MKLQELFPPENVLIGFASRDKWDAIGRIMKHLTTSEQLPSGSSATLFEAVMQREKSMSTGMERGLAIPHAAVDELDQVVACLAVLGADGLNFESIDGSATRLISLLLIPRSQKLLHIRTLANVARVLGRDAVQTSLFAASTSEEAWHALDEVS